MDKTFAQAFLIFFFGEIFDIDCWLASLPLSSLHAKGESMMNLIVIGDELMGYCV